MKKKRDSGIELLRIFAMLMVIGVHIFVYGGYFDTAREQSGIVWSSAYFMRLFFRPAVNIFIIITGYFMVHSPFDLKSLTEGYYRYMGQYCSILSYLALSCLQIGLYLKQSIQFLLLLVKCFFPCFHRNGIF